MQKFIFMALLALCSFVSLGLPARGEDKDKDPAPAADKVVPHGVVQVGEEFLAVETAKLKDHKKEHDKAYKDAVKAWEAAKKEAKKSKEKFTTAKPKPIFYKVIAPKLKSLEAATAQAAKLKEELEKEKERKRAKEAKKK